MSDRGLMISRPLIVSKEKKEKEGEEKNPHQPTHEGRASINHGFYKICINTHTIECWVLTLTEWGLVVNSSWPLSSLIIEGQFLEKGINQLFRATVFICPQLAKVNTNPLCVSPPLSYPHTHTYSVTNPHQSHTMPSPLPLLGDRRIKRSTEHCSKYKQQLRSLRSLPLQAENRQAAVTKVITL